MNGPSIRKQVFYRLAAYTALIFLSLIAASFLFAFVVEDEVIERLLVLQGDVLVEGFEDSGEYPSAQLPGFEVYTATEQMPVLIRKAYLNNPHISEVFTPDESHYHVRTLSSGVVLVAEVSNLLVVSNPSSHWLYIMAAILLALMAFAMLLTVQITRTATRPIISLSEEVQGNPDPTPRFQASQRGDEIGYLARSIEAAVLELHDSLERESAFTRDVSHELRTPLTILKNDVLTSQAGSSRSRQLAAIEQMERTIHMLLAIARSESIEVEKFSLTALIEEVILANSGDIESTGFTLDMLFSEQWFITANRQLASLVISNLLINAMRHSADGRLAIDMAAGDLIFSNQHNEQLAPKQDIGIGIGQGLYLTQRICDALGWVLEITRSGDLHQVAIRAPFSR